MSKLSSDAGDWIDHWVKAIQSGLVNTLARGMAQSYTDLAAQHAIEESRDRRPLSPPPVPQGVPRFTSRNRSSNHEAFPSRKFRKVLEICQRRSTSMISNDTESQSEYSISQYY